MDDDDAALECANGCPKCVGDDGIITAGLRLCGQCCHDHLSAGEEGTEYTLAMAMLKVKEGGGIVLAKSGAEITDWSGLKSEAKHDRALQLVGGFLPLAAGNSDTPYPRQKRPEEVRTYANAAHFHIW